MYSFSVPLQSVCPGAAAHAPADRAVLPAGWYCCANAATLFLAWQPEGLSLLLPAKHIAHQSVDQGVQQTFCYSLVMN